LLSSFALTACEDDSDGDQNENPTDSFTATIDGTAWTAKITSWASSGGTVQLNSELKSDNSSMQIFIPQDTTGVFDAVDNLVTVSYKVGNIFWSNSVSGFVDVDVNTNEHIEGTFNLRIASAFNSDTLAFTAGKFFWKR
jgi:hypothetical protein